MQNVMNFDFAQLFLKITSVGTLIRISGSKCDGFFLPIPEGKLETPRLRVMYCKFAVPCVCASPLSLKT